MSSITKESILEDLLKYEERYGCFPSRRDARLQGISESAVYRIFGSYEVAKEMALLQKVGQVVEPAAKTVKDGLMETLKKNLTEAELRTLVAATGVSSFKPKLKHSPVTTGHIKFIATGDSHIGHSEFRDDWWAAMVSRGVEEGVDFLLHTGDILEGMSGRPGHVYELAQIGFEAQFAKAKDMINLCPFPFKAIIGNHDQWYCGKGDQGLNVGLRLDESIPHFEYLGMQEADIVVEGVKIKLWHGLDGSAYSLSYRTQKFVEMLSGGEKPNILLAGHTHKSIFYQTRNVNVFETGTTCGQTGFMRGKKLAAHTGFWIVDVWSNESGLVRIRPEWTPFY